MGYDMSCHSMEYRSMILFSTVWSTVWYSGLVLGVGYLQYCVGHCVVRCHGLVLGRGHVLCLGSPWSCA